MSGVDNDRLAELEKCSDLRIFGDGHFILQRLLARMVNRVVQHSS